MFFFGKFLLSSLAPPTLLTTSCSPFPPPPHFKGGRVIAAVAHSLNLSVVIVGRVEVMKAKKEIGGKDLVITVLKNAN